MWRQGDCLLDRVNHPAQNGLSGLPGGIAFAEFFDRDGFRAKGVVGAEGGENGVDGVQQVASQRAQAPRRALTQGNEVIHVDVHGSDGAKRRLVGAVGWDGGGG